MKKQVFLVVTLHPSSYSSSGQLPGKQEDGWWGFFLLSKHSRKHPPLGWKQQSSPVSYSYFLSSMVGLSGHNLAFLIKEKVFSSTFSFSRLISTWTVSTWTLVLAYGSRWHRSKTRRQGWGRPDFLEANKISASFWSLDVKVSTPRLWCPGIIPLRASI